MIERGKSLPNRLLEANIVGICGKSPVTRLSR
jgi:hypothetical protein